MFVVFAVKCTSSIMSCCPKSIINYITAIVLNCLLDTRKINICNCQPSQTQQKTKNKLISKSKLKERKIERKKDY